MFNIMAEITTVTVAAVSGNPALLFRHVVNMPAYTWGIGVKSHTRRVK